MGAAQVTDITSGADALVIAYAVIKEVRFAVSSFVPVDAALLYS